jgi:hypothetical protein
MDQMTDEVFRERLCAALAAHPGADFCVVSRARYFLARELTHGTSITVVPIRASWWPHDAFEVGSSTSWACDAGHPR